MMNSEPNIKRKHVAVIGGGQLARMMVEDVHSNLNAHLMISTMDPGADCPAAQINRVHYCAPFKNVGSSEDAESIQKNPFYQYFKYAEGKQQAQVDVVTFEIEHVDIDALEVAVRHINHERSNGNANGDKDIQIHPHPKTLKIIQDKYQQKLHLQQVVPMSQFMEVRSMQDLKNVVAAFGYPFLLKTKVGAYDGKGNFVVKSEEELIIGVQSLTGNNLGSSDRLDNLYAEKFVNFDRELAVMVCNQNDTVVAYPVVHTVQKDNVCHQVICPDDSSSEVLQKARDIAVKVVSSFHGNGVYGVELFRCADGRVLFNEVAPRPHNSGHYTIEACHTSQFEQHLRAVSGLPLGQCGLKVGAAVMQNMLGSADCDMEQMIAGCQRLMSVPGATVHWYGKSKCSNGRKMGHVTLCGDNVSAILAHLELDKVSTFSSYARIKYDVAVIMGSDSDLPIMSDACKILDTFGVSYLCTIVSAHRTSDRLSQFARSAHKNGFKVIIAGAGGAAHLAGMCASMTPLPVIGVPIALKHLNGVDSLYSTVQMPRGVPCATVAINNAENAGLLAVRILGKYNDKMLTYQKAMTESVIDKAHRLETLGWQEYLSQKESQQQQQQQQKKQ
ncbi:hypothetical protein MIR68_007778 [Amoeboaphelidium protococcarum]|nr:hypothetical protein MIR68_007778 [Amoeboaphelidium protococcarum]